jgi:hypothetical protein
LTHGCIVERSVLVLLIIPIIFTVATARGASRVFEWVASTVGKRA